MGTLRQALASVPDPRTHKGRRCPLASVLAISLVAMRSGAIAGAVILAAVIVNARGEAAKGKRILRRAGAPTRGAG